MERLAAGRCRSKSTGKSVCAEFEENMRNAEKYARVHSVSEQERYAKYYNADTKDKSFQLGEQVVVLKKDSTHKPFARWKQGKILRVRSPYSYDVELAG